MRNTKNRLHAGNDPSFTPLPQLRRGNCNDWGVFEDKSRRKDWPSMRQTAKDCDGWLEGACREAVGRAQEFNNLVETWRRETGLMSSLEEKFLHPAYQRIIGMGKEAIPLILQELKQRPGHWFWALKAITGENPMHPEHAGNLRRMTEDWLEWGSKNGYVWINC